MHKTTRGLDLQNHRHSGALKYHIL